MTLEEAFAAVASQMVAGDTVELEGKRYPVKRSSSHRLKMVTFTVDGEEYTAIEQNPDKPSRWGQLAREGKKVIQFKDVKSNRFVAVSMDGDVKKYGSK